MGRLVTKFLMLQKVMKLQKIQSIRDQNGHLTEIYS